MATGRVNIGGGNIVKRVLQYNINTSSATTNVTIPSVDTTKSIIKINAVRGGEAHRAHFTSATNVRLTRIGTAVCTVSFEVIEFVSVRQIISASVVATANTTTNFAHTFTLDKSSLFFSCEFVGAIQPFQDIYGRLQTNQVSFENPKLQDANVQYYIVEFY